MGRSFDDTTSFPIARRTEMEFEEYDSDINDTLMTTLAACGDVNRNVMSNPNPYQSEAHERGVRLGTAALASSSAKNACVP